MSSTSNYNNFLFVIELFFTFLVTSNGVCCEGVEDMIGSKLKITEKIQNSNNFIMLKNDLQSMICNLFVLENDSY